MADPFEVRMRFSAQLQHLNASVISLQKAASYALKYKEMDEDLHSCILEQLERVRVPLGSHFGPLFSLLSNYPNILFFVYVELPWPLTDLFQTNMNTRANIMFFIEHFMEMASKENHTNYITMLQRDIIRVVDAVAPDDESGAANVKVVQLVSYSRSLAKIFHWNGPLSHLSHPHGPRSFPHVS